ncbi:MAG TPA: hypothetical protein VK745_05195 [Polyangiaceae bacterium]|jgi:hypothetical protein|nr:hypothetical protein [Polyangiaceae bacterium]
MTSCKDDCEALMSAVLPSAEQMLIEHHALQPFGSTLSADSQITQIGGWVVDSGSLTPELVAEFERSFRDGATRGELKATALVQPVLTVPPGKLEQQAGVSIHLDHRDDYSIVVTFPYRFSSNGELVIEEPFAREGEHTIFQK